MKRTRVTIGVLAALLQVPVFAAADPATSFGQLPRLLKSGDVIAVTLWSDREHRGPLTGLTSCSLTVLTRGERVQIESGQIRKIKRLARGRSESRPDADAAKSCEGAPCAAMSMAFAAGATIGRALQLLPGPATVYRAERSTPAAICAAAVQNRTEPAEPSERAAARLE